MDGLAQNAPPEPIDNPNHGITGIEQSPSVGNNVTAESNGRNIQAELNHKRDQKTKIAIANL